MAEYFKMNNLPYRKTGMLVVPTNKEENDLIKTYYEEGIKRNINLQLLSAEKAIKIEPVLKPKKEFKVLYSPDVCTTYPKHYIYSLANELMNLSNVKVHLS